MCSSTTKIYHHRQPKSLPFFRIVDSYFAWVKKQITYQLKLIKLNKIPAEKTIMVGDYKHDIEAGVSAKVHTIYSDGAKTHEWRDIAESSVEGFWELLDFFKR